MIGRSDDEISGTLYSRGFDAENICCERKICHLNWFCSSSIFTSPNACHTSTRFGGWGGELAIQLHFGKQNDRQPILREQQGHARDWVQINS